MNMICPNCGDDRTNNLPIDPKPGELMCAKCNRRFDSRIVDGVIQIQKFKFEREYAPYDQEDHDVLMKIKIDDMNEEVAKTNKLNEVIEQVNILLRKQK